jgi:hypothetical protein
LDAILERLGSWDADVLAEVYRNGQLTAMYAPQQLQQHQQQLLTAPASVTDVSISMKCVIRNQRQNDTCIAISVTRDSLYHFRYSAIESSLRRCCRQAAAASLQHVTSETIQSLILLAVALRRLYQRQLMA